MADKAEGHRRGLESAPADFIELLGKAILSGIAASVVLVLVTLGLATTASAQTMPNDSQTGTEGAFAPAPKVETDVVSGMPDNLPWSVALTPSPGGDPTGVSALWAKARIASLVAGELAQTDADSTLHVALGLLALVAAAMVALVGRFIQPGRAASPMRDAQGER